MKGLTLFALFLLAAVHSQGEGIQFTKAAWSQVLQDAHKANKIIFVDFYATWCGPCRGMERDVFPHPEVAAYFNEHFVSKRIDAEKDELALVEKMKLEAYPTLAFFDPDGKLIYKIVGASGAEEMVAYGKKASRIMDVIRRESWKQEEGDWQLYVESVGSIDPLAAEKQVADRFATLPVEKIKDEGNFMLLTQYVTDMDNPAWQYVIKNASYFAAHFELSYYLQKLGYAVLEKAAAARNPAALARKSELDLLITRLNGDSSNTQEFYQSWNLIHYYEKAGDQSNYVKVLDKTIKKYHWKDSPTLTCYAFTIINGSYGSNADRMSVQWAQQALKVDPQNYLPLWLLAIGYEKSKNPSKSAAAMKRFVQMSSKDGDLPAKIIRLYEH